MKLTILPGAVACLLVALAGGCAQPPTECTVGRHYPYAAKYELVAGEGSGPCAELAGDVIGMSAYNPVDADGRPILTEGSFAMRTGYTGGRVAAAEERGVRDTNADHAPFSLGLWKSVIPEDDFCEPKDGMEPAVQELPAVPPDVGDPNDPDDDFAGLPATSLREQWTDVRFYVTAAAPGTQMSARYKLTHDTCEAEYEVLAVYAAASCEGEDGRPDDAYCSAEPQPDKGIVYGSGINPDFPVKCDPDLLLCVLDAEPGSKLPILKR